MAQSPSAPSPVTCREPGRPGPIRRLGRLIRRLYRIVRALLALTMLALILLLFVPAIDRLYLWMSVATPPTKADAIVCLGGHTIREVMAAQLYHRGFAPVVVVSNAPGAAEAMRRLVVNCGVPRDKILVDNTSYTTADHPAGVARLPGMDPQRQTFIIVTDHSHSRRAGACFRKAGYQHIAVYAGRPASREIPAEYWDRVRWRVLTMPQMLYETAGLVQYWWQDRI